MKYFFCFKISYNSIKITIFRTSKYIWFYLQILIFIRNNFFKQGFVRFINKI